jgi:hypothetical protein
MNVFSSSLSPNYDGNNFGTNFVIRNQMFLPLPIGADRNILNKFFLSDLYDVSPWIAIDLGTGRTVNAVQISQDASRASSGNYFYL